MALMIGFWVLLGVFSFAFVLALQMRLMIGVIVARALRARDENLDIAASRLAVVKAGNGQTGEAAVNHIHATYPAQMAQLRLARRVSIILPVFISGLLILGRLSGRI